MIKFSVEQQIFYDYSQQNFNVDSVPETAIEVDSEDYVRLLNKIGMGFYVKEDLTISSTPRPSYFHVYENDEWVDSRTPEEISQTLKSLTRRQFKLALLDNNLTSSIETLINSIGDEAIKARIEIEYNESTNFERLNPSVVLMLQSLGLTVEQVNTMWINALDL
jgi:DNA phosphorothioation-dependent restriction protein DptG